MPLLNDIILNQIRNNTIITLNLKGSIGKRLRTHEIRQLAELLTRNQSVLSIDLSNNKMTDEKLKILINALQTNTYLEYIDLSENFITSEGVSKIDELVEINTTILEINLSKNNFKSSVDETDIKWQARSVYIGIPAAEGATFGAGIGAMAVPIALITAPIGATLGGLGAGAVGFAYLKTHPEIINKAIEEAQVRAERNINLLQRINQSLERNRESLITIVQAYPTDFVDSKNRTALHIFVRLKKRALLAQRLRINRDDVTLTDGEGITPPQLAVKLCDPESCALFLCNDVEYSSFIPADDEIFRSQVVKFRDDIVSKNQMVNHSLHHLLAIATSGNSVIYDPKFLKQAYKGMLTFPELVPVLQIAAIATLGLHDLGAKLVPINAERPINLSDPTTYRIENQPLRIVIDHLKNHIENLILEKIVVNGREVFAYGVYTRKNQLYVGGNRGNPLMTRGTLVHEITHFVAEEVFKNNCNPYHSTHDEVNMQRFARIKRDLRDRQHTLHERLESVFRSYPESQWDVELIVRIPQLIAMNNGYDIVNNQCPELLAYFRDIFIPACQIHYGKMKEKNYIVEGAALRIHPTPIIEATSQQITQIDINFQREQTAVILTTNNTYHTAATFFNTISEDKKLKKKVGELEAKIIIEDSKEEKSSQPYYQLADLYYKQVKLKAAIYLYKKIILFDSSDRKVSAYHNMGCYYHILGDHSKAEKSLREGISINPHPGLYCELGHFLIVRNRHEEAIEFLQKTIIADCNNRYLAYGTLEKFTVDKQLALEIEQRKDIEINSQILAYFLLAKSYLKLNKKIEAEEIAQTMCLAVENTSNGLYFSLLGHIYQKLDDVSNAIKCFESIMQLEPNNLRIKNNLTLCLEKQICEMQQSVPRLQRAGL